MKKLVLLPVIILLAQHSFGCSASFTPAMAPVNNALLRVNFTNSFSPSVAPAGQNIRFIYRYGDGTSDTSSNVSGTSHVYASTGTYTAKIIIQLVDSPAMTTIYCTDSSTTTVNVTYQACATSFDTSYGSGFSVTFTAHNPAATSGMTYSWTFGDGNNGSGSPITHTYSTGGSYSVTLTATSTLPCSYTNTQTITLPNYITGLLEYDSVHCFLASPTYKVWLITYNPTTQVLNAVDSLTIPSQFNGNQYVFYNKPAATYRVKAMITNGPSSGTGPLPTYGYDTSLYWNTADSVVYSGAGSAYLSVFIGCGTVTSGPGFISGNVNLGANKGTKTTNGQPGVEILLANASGTSLAYALTDANGHFSFSNLPVATGAGSTYRLYPEVLGYQNTPWYVTLTTTNPSDTSSAVHISTNHHTAVPTEVSKITTAANSIVVYPNPSTGLVNISSSENAHAIISDVVGHKVYEANITTGNTQLSLSNLGSGMYFLNVSSADINYSSKIILQY